MMRESLFKGLIVATLLIFTACGGGSSSSDNTTASDTENTPIEESTNTPESNNTSEELNTSDTNTNETDSANEETTVENSNSEPSSEDNGSDDDNSSQENSLSVTGEESANETEENDADTPSTSDNSSAEQNTTNTNESNETSSQSNENNVSETDDSEATPTENEESNATDSNSTESNTTTQETNEVNLTQSIQKAKAEPYFKYAWHIESKENALNEQGYTINDNADINLTAAWELSMGEGVKVAVIDDGAEVEHEDLKENILLAYNADDKGNEINPNAEKGSHGNTCAGFIAAPINETGIVGVAPKAKIIAIRQEEASDEKVIHAFEYAKSNGAKVISCSWGTENVSEAVVSQLKSLYDSGITVVFASGNDGKSLDEGSEDESEVEWVIGVGASGENNDVTSYSNYGINIDVIAPGGDTQMSSGILGLDDMGENGGKNQLDLVNNNYTFTDGTSFATPVVAGVIALMYEVNPNITPKQVRDILIETADKVGTEVDADYSNNNFDTKRAFGKINAGKAVLQAKKLAQ